MAIKNKMIEWTFTRLMKNLIVLTLLISTNLPANAQQNPFGTIIGGMLGAAIIENAKTEWNNLPEPKKSCLLNELQRRNVNVIYLIQNGIGPNDQRLAQINYPCEQLQRKKDDEQAAIEAAEEERLAEEERQKQLQIAEEKRKEQERVAKLNGINLNKNTSCKIKENNIEYMTLCDELLVLSNNTSEYITIKQAIKNKIQPNELKIEKFEIESAKSRRKELASLYKYINNIPTPSFDCQKTKYEYQKIICDSFILTTTEITISKNNKLLKSNQKLISDMAAIDAKFLKLYVKCKNTECIADAMNSYLNEQVIIGNKYSIVAMNNEDIKNQLQIDDENGKKIYEENLRKEQERIAEEKKKIEEQQKIEQEKIAEEKRKAEEAEKIRVATLQQEEEKRQNEIKNMQEQLLAIEKSKKESKEAKLRETKNKGIDYANSINTIWDVQTIKNEMTDKNETVVSSLQKSKEGSASVEIELRCVKQYTKIKISIFGKDNKGLNVVNSNSNRLGAQIRIDDGDVTATQFSTDKFSNVFTLAIIKNGRANYRDLPQSELEKKTLMALALGLDINAIDLINKGHSDEIGFLDEENWRILASLDTVEGTVVAKVPLYQSEIRQLIESCNK